MKQDSSEFFFPKVQCVGEVTADKIWHSFEADVWKSPEFAGKLPDFYTVYRHKDYYSTSLLSLILHKRSLHVQPAIHRMLASKRFLHCPTNLCIDRDIVRIGRPLRSSPSLYTEDAIANAIAAGMVKDIRKVEQQFPGYTHVLMVGGRDSQNMTLLPWSQPVIVVSGQPNLPLVQEFVKRNKLPYPVEELTSDDSIDDSRMIAESMCRVTLEHVRYLGKLRQIAGRLDYKVVIWSGQTGDIMQTQTWKHYRPAPRRFKRLHRMKHELFMHSPWANQVYLNALWHKAAAWQGVCCSINRDLLKCPFLSCYHGPAMRQVAAEIDYTAIEKDIRPMVAQHILGHGEPLLSRPVWYPDTNPGPPQRKLKHPRVPYKQLIQILASKGVAVKRPKSIFGAKKVYP